MRCDEMRKVGEPFELCKFHSLRFIGQLVSCVELRLEFISMRVMWLMWLLVVTMREWYGVLCTTCKMHSCTNRPQHDMIKMKASRNRKKKRMNIRDRKRSLSLAIRKHSVVTMVILVVIAALLAVVAIDGGIGRTVMMMVPLEWSRRQWRS